MTDQVDPLGGIEPRMRLVIEALERDLAKVRVGGASGSLVDGITVDHLGRRVRLVELATVTIPDPRQVVIRPWDPSTLRAIGTAISHSRIGLTPTIDGSTIRLYVPAITAERREELASLVRQRVERAHVDLRTIRHDAMATVRERGRAHVAGADDVRRDLERLQRMTDRATAQVDALGEAKAATIRRV